MANDPDTSLPSGIPERVDPAQDELRASDTKGDSITAGDVSGTGIAIGPNAQANVIFTEEQAYKVSGLANPYLGLQAFTAAERDIFAGRKRIVKSLVERLSADDAERLLFIVGASGSGKSSLVRAGLLPQLEERLHTAGYDVRAQIIEHPGRTMGQTLAEIQSAKLTSSKTCHLLLIDQFEELFTQTSSDDHQRALTLLADLVAKPDRPLRIIVAMRSDFLPHLIAYSRFEAAEQRKVVLRAMSIEDLAEAIQRPIQVRHPDKRIEPALVERLAIDAAADAAYLPLLQVTLEDLWRGGELRLGKYTGLADAIQRRANTVYTYRDYDDLQEDKRPLEEQRIIIDLFLALVRVSLTEEKHLLRWRRSRSELVQGDPQREQLIVSLATARLLRTDHEVVQEDGHEREVETVDIVHEALLSGWPTISDAVARERELLRRRARFDLAVSEWLAHGKHDDYLLTGVRLAEAEALKQRNDSVFQRDGAEEFYTRTVAKRKDALDAERKRTAALRRRAILASGIGVIAFLLGIIALVLYRTADYRSQTALARQLASQADTDTFPQRSLLLAIEAISITRDINIFRPTDSRNRLLRLLSSSGGVTLNGQTSNISAIAFSQEDQLVVAGLSSGELELWDVNDLQHPPRILARVGSAITTIAFSNGTEKPLFATGSDNGEVNLWNISDLQAVPISFRDNTKGITKIVFSRNNRWLAVGGSDGTVRIRESNAENTFVTQSITVQNEGCFDQSVADVFDIAFSADSRWMFVGYWCHNPNRDPTDGVIQLYDLSKPEPFNNPQSRIISQFLALSVSPNGQWLAITTAYDAFLWNIKEDSVLLEGAVKLVDPKLKTRSHAQFVTSVAFAPDSLSLATGSVDTTVKIWDVAKSPPANNPRVLRGHGATVRELAFSSTGWLITRSDDTTARVWNIADPLVSVVVLRGHEAGVNAFAINNKGNRAITVSDDKSARLWNIPDAYASSTVLYGHKDGVGAVTFSPLITSPTGLKTQWLATGAGDHIVRLWNMDHIITTPIELTGHNSTIKNLSFSVDGRWLAASTWESPSILIWDRPYNNPSVKPTTLIGHRQGITGLAFSPDGRWLASASWDGTIWLWNTSTITSSNPYAGSFLLDEHRSVIRQIAFSGDGHWLVSGSDDGTAKVWDLYSASPNQHPITLQHPRGINAITVSHDGKWVAAGLWDDNTVYLWDMKQTNTTPIIVKFKARVFSLDFSKDGNWFGAASWDFTTQLLELNKLDSKPVVLQGHQGRILALAFSPDSQWIATAGEDHTARLWNLTELDAAPIVLRGHEAGIYDYAMAFSSDSRWLATGSTDETVRVWPLQLNDLISLACQIAGRNLSEQEWQQFLSDKAYHKTCPNLPLHPSFIDKGRDLARSGDIKGAVAQFKKALTLEPTLDIDPEQEAQRVAVEASVTKGRELAKAGDVEAAQEQFRAALAISPTLVLSPDMEIRQLAVPAVRAKGQELAKAGDLEGAMAQFKRVLELDPTLDLKPDVEIQEYQAKGLIDKAIDLAWIGDIKGTVAQLRRAKEVNPQLDIDLAASLVNIADWLAANGRSEGAVAAYLEAQMLNSNLQFSAKQWNTLCWHGSLAGRATDVLDACNRAVELAPDDQLASYRDSRGLALALTGDVVNAVEDFKAFVDWAQRDGTEARIIEERRRWIKDLEDNHSPFDVFNKATLEQLRLE